MSNQQENLLASPIIFLGGGRSKAWGGAERKADFIVISERYKIFYFGSIACESEMWSKGS